PDEIHKQEFHIGINDNFGDPVTGKAFSPIVFTLFDKWANLRSGHGHDHDNHGYGDRDRDDDDRHGHNDHDRDDFFGGSGSDEARRSVARGQALFNTHPITISGVSGINDEAAFGKPAVVMGTCTTCHDTPNGGNHSVVAP